MSTKMLFLLILLFPPGLNRVFAQDAGALIDKVRSRLAAVKDYRAEGVMKLDVSFMKVPPSDITVFFEQPDKLRIRQHKGISITPKGGINANLSGLLNDEKYAAILTGKGKVGDYPVAIVKLLPLDDKSNIVVATLYIDEENALVRKATTTTRDNGTYDIDLQYGRYSNWALPDKVIFTFNTRDYKLPKGLAFDYDDGSEKPDPGSTSQKGRVEITYSQYLINKGLGKEDAKQ